MWTCEAPVADMPHLLFPVLDARVSFYRDQL
jgi:hypothetical protein